MVSRVHRNDTEWIGGPLGMKQAHEGLPHVSVADECESQLNRLEHCLVQHLVERRFKRLFFTALFV